MTIAIFSCDPGVSPVIYITTADGWSVIASYRPPIDANPLKYLAAQGWVLVYPQHAYLLKATMGATGYAKVSVVSAP